LRSLKLEYVPFPGLPKLLLYIPGSGYITPEVMATSLEFLRLRFLYPRPPPALESRRPPPPPLTRSTLPRLNEILFRGASDSIFRGDLGPYRCPSTQQIAYNLLQSNHMRHTTTLPVHQSKTNAEGTGKGPYRSPKAIIVKSHARLQNGSFHPLSRSASRFHVGRTLHLRGSRKPTRLAR
jgi:hypothetical protein